MSELFGRLVSLQLGQEGEEGRAYEGLRVGFDVTHTSDSKPSKARITVYNLNDESIARIRGPRGLVRLFAGYATMGAPRLIFQGNPVKDGVILSRQGPDRVLTIEAQDGGRAYRDARVEIAFSGSTSLGQVYAELQRQIGLPAGKLALDRDIEFPAGLTLSGSAREVMGRIAEMSGSRWWIRDGVIQIAEGGDTGETGPLLSSATGNLIGEVSRREKNEVEVTCLLDPGLRPGKRFRAESREVTGNYVAKQVIFRGDSGFAQPFYAIVVGRPL